MKVAVLEFEATESQAKVRFIARPLGEKLTLVWGPTPHDGLTLSAHDVRALLRFIARDFVARLPGARG